MESKRCKKLALPLLLSLSAATASLAQTENDPEDPKYYAELDTITIKGHSVEDAGFAFIAKFRKKMIWAGIKTLVVTKVGADSPAAKAGIEKGAKIVKIRNTEINGLKIKELQALLQEKSEDGRIPLTIIPKNKEAPQEVILEFRFEKTKKQKKAEKKKAN